MFSGAKIRGERLGLRMMIGAVIAFTGLAWLLWPSGAPTPSPTGAATMALAAIGWGAYSLAGRSTTNPLGETAANFLLSLPFGLLALVLAPLHVSPLGAGLAVVSGAITSGLGYALWYAVLPKLRTSTAAISQLTVPAIAALGATVLLQEPLTPRLVSAGLLVIGGIAFALLRPPAAAAR